MPPASRPSAGWPGRRGEHNREPRQPAVLLVDLGVVIPPAGPPDREIRAEAERTVVSALRLKRANCSRTSRHTRPRSGTARSAKLSHPYPSPVAPTGPPAPPERAGRHPTSMPLVRCPFPTPDRRGTTQGAHGRLRHRANHSAEQTREAARPGRAGHNTPHPPALGTQCSTGTSRRA
jgi:hypothetical protein